MERIIMFMDELKSRLRFYFITDENAPVHSPLEQVKFAIQAGAGIIQYRHKSFSTSLYEEVAAIRDLCKSNSVPFLVNDNVMLAKAVAADGVHLGQEDDSPAVARRILGSAAVIGISVSNLDELARTDLGDCDYIGTGPVFTTQTKTDAKPACGLTGLAAVVQASSLPVVAIGGIDSNNAPLCFQQGAAGVAVISHISRAARPIQNARQLASICGCLPPDALLSSWNDEFGLIDELLKDFSPEKRGIESIRIPPGDDACLLCSLKNPVVSTDTQKEGIHFRLDWQSLQDIGHKAVVVTLSDLAASYAKPIAFFVNLALPSNVSSHMARQIYEGIKAALSQHDCALGGGNISRSSQLSLDLFAIGEGHNDIFPTRSTARPGDGLYVTGPLGLARAGLDALTKKDRAAHDLIGKFKRPSARFDAAGILAGNHVTCVMDISDGLAGDAAHIARASKISIEFDLKTCLVDPALLSYCRKNNLDPEAMILSGGEDYELLFTCAPDKFIAIQAELETASQVGRCLPYDGRYLLNLPRGISSFQHGAR